MAKSVKVAVTGAAGQIGYALLFRIASGEMFGPKTEVHLRLLELEPALPALEGTVMELKDCGFPLLKSVFITAEAVAVFEDVDWALLVGSVPRQAGMERGDLLKVNGKVFVEQGKALDMVASPECRVLVVGNPCNTNAYIAKSFAKRLRPRNFFALMMLDQTRACAQLAEKADQDITQINNIAVWGNHSASQFPDFYHGTIQGNKIIEVISDISWLQGPFLEQVQKRGAAVIQKRGKSSAASAANAVIETVKALSHPTPEGEFFSVGVCSDGSYGVEEGLIFGFPVKSDGQDWQIEQGIEHEEYARKKIDFTYKELLAEKNAVKII